jgi:small GTP-binding protein
MKHTLKFTPEENKYLIKIVVIGDVNVGKTNIIRRLLGEEYKEMESTIGVEFAYINIDNIDPEDKTKKLSIQIWDTSGAERYRSITTSHIRNADGAYIVYDVTNESSFENLNFWYDCIRNSTDEDIIIYLIGNKSDLIYEHGRMVPKENAINFVKNKNLHGYAECSAKNNENVSDTFKSFYKTIYKRNKMKLEEKTKNKLELEKKISKEREKKECCEY